MINKYLNLHTLVVALPLALSPLLLIQLRQCWQLWYYAFYPVALVLLAFLVYKEWRPPTWPSKPRVLWSRALAAIAVFLGGVSAIVYSPWLAHASALTIFGSWLLQRFNQTSWRIISTWLLMLLSFMPIPLDLQDRFVWFLLSTAAESAGNLLDLLGVANFLEGTNLAVGAFSIDLAAFVSVFESVWLILAIAIFIACKSQLGPVQSMLLISSAPIWSWAASTTRILIAALSHEWLSVRLTLGWTKELVSLLVLLVVMLMILATSRLLAAVFNRVPSSAEKAEANKALKKLYNKLTGHSKDEAVANVGAEDHSNDYKFNGGFLTTCLVIAAICYWGTFKKPLLGNPSTFWRLSNNEKFKESIRKDSLPNELLGMTVVDFELKRNIYHGILRPEYHAVWRFLKGDQTIELALRLPIRGVAPIQSDSSDSGIRFSNTNLLQVAEGTATETTIPLNYVREVYTKNVILGDQYKLSTKLFQADSQRWESIAIDSEDRLSRLLRSLQVQPMGFELSLRLNKDGQDLEAEEKKQLINLLATCVDILGPVVNSAIDN